MPVNWNLGLTPDIIGTAMNAFEQGKQMRREEASRNAMAAILRPTPAGQTPGIGDGVGANRPDPYSQLTPQDMATVQQFQQRQSQIDQRQQEARTAQMQQTGRLLRMVKADPSRYQQARAAAIQMGIPAQSIPETYSPDWVDQQVMIADAFEKDGGQQLTSTMKELVALGYKPGTPEFQQALAQTMNAGYSKPYTDASGATRLYTPNIAVPAQPAPQQVPAPQQAVEPITIDQFRGYADVQGVGRAARWLQETGQIVRVTTPDEAMQLPSGTRILLPDGTEGRVP